MVARKNGTTRAGSESRSVDALLADRRSARYLPILLLFFFASGCAALVYEIVWFQALELSIGSSAMSIAVLLATYMGGMCIGSLGIGRFIETARHPLRVYAGIEFGIGAFAVIVLFLLPYAGGLYTAIGGPGFGGLMLRGLISMLCLLPPTILMGATLPAVARWVESTPQGRPSWTGFLYGGNTIGSFVGCLLAGFYLLPNYDMWIATYVAVAINVVVGASALMLARRVRYEPPASGVARAARASGAPVWPVLVSIALSGMTALGAEVVWTRLLSLQLGATVYTYSLILAAVLLGIGLGGYLGSLLIRFTRIEPRLLLGACQALIMLAIAWAAYLVNVVFPVEPKDAALSANAIVSFMYGMSRSLWAVLPAALLWGASFPLALASVQGHDSDPGRGVGRVYAANTAGAIVGSLAAPLLILPAIGSQQLQQWLVIVAAISATLAFWPWSTSSKTKSRASDALAPRALALAPVAFGLLVALVVPPVSAAVVGYGPGSYAWNSGFGEFIYVGEGMNGDVAISRNVDGVLNYHNAGKVQASSQPGDLRLQRMLGHLTTLQQSNPESVLVIGCGAGVTAGAVSVDPAVKQLTIVEIEPLVPKAAQEYMAGVNAAVVANPKTDVVIDDGRHYLMTSKQKFDAITLDPFDPWTKGAASLSTEEFYESIRDHLKPGGTVTIWVPLYQTRAATVKSEIATFMKVFPNAVIWDNVTTGGAGDVVLSGRVGDEPIDIDAVEERLATSEYQPVRESMQSIGFASASDLFSTFGVRGADMADWLAGAEINTDRNLRLQYLAGSSLGTIEPEDIYANMVSGRQWPEGLFTGSVERIDSLRKASFGQ